MIRHPPTSPLFPYTTLFRSIRRRQVATRDRPAHWDYDRILKSADKLALAGPFANDEGGLFVYNAVRRRSEEHTSELQSHVKLVCRLLLDKKKGNQPCFSAAR